MRHLTHNLYLEVADRQALRWAQARIAACHYLRAPVDPRCRPFAYLLRAEFCDDPIGCLIFGRPEATRCYDGALTYGSPKDVADGRAQFDRWEVLNLARVWLSPSVQAGGRWCTSEFVPGFTDRHGAWRPTLASWAIGEALGRVGYDYLRAHPPVDCDYPYQIRAVLSYCDRSLHRGTIYRAAGFRLARTNERGIETWWTGDLGALSPDQDAEIRRLAELTPRSRRIRAARAQLTLFTDDG
jgi:hypothetical protein